MAPDSDDLDSMASLKDVIDDDVFKLLRKIFLRIGRGRPCDRPQISEVTNRLLLQLYFLKEESSTSFRQLKEWMERLVPHMQIVTETRIYHRIQSIISVCKSLQATPDHLITFLAEPYCFHDVADSLSALGLKRYHLQEAVPYDVPPSADVRNEVIIDLEKLRAHERQDQSFVHKWIHNLSLSSRPLSKTQMKRKVDKCHKTYQTLNKSKNKSDARLKEFEEFLKAPFLNDGVIATIQEPFKCIMCTSLLDITNVQDSKIQMLNCENSEISYKLQIQKSINSDLASEVEQLKDRGEHVLDLKDELGEVIKKNIILEKEVEEVSKTKLYAKNYVQKKHLQQVIEENVTLSSEIECKSLTINSMSECISSLKKKLKTEQSLKSKYKVALDKHSKMNLELSDMLECEKDDDVKLRESGSSHRYSDSIRKTFYDLQGEGNVAASNCSSVVATVAKNLFNANINMEDLPCKSTSLNFSNEANFIAQHQVVEEIKKADHFMFACDATSRQKAHFLEQHIQLSTGKQLSLGFSEIASDDSDTLLEKCIDVFDNMCDIYCLDTSVDHFSLFKEIVRKMKALMSDRASVMKSFDKKMAAYKCNILEGEDCSTHFIFCNAHFLLALSSAAAEAIDSVEAVLKEDGSKLGRDSNPVYSSFEKCKETAAVRAIRTAADCLGPRGDEKNGSRQEWLAFCSSKQIRSKFTSYRSNRFNNLFQNATALLLHKDDINTFLSEYVSHSNLKLQSVIADIKDNNIITNVAAISFFHVFFTEPYWLLMNSHHTYFDFPAYVKLMDDALCHWRTETFNPVDAVSVFPDLNLQASDKDVEVVKMFFASDDYDMLQFSSALHMIIDKCKDALIRQLCDFLDGGIFGGEIEDDVKTVLSSCPLTNLTGERLFGDLDYDMHKRRNASLYLRSTTSMWKRNKTSGWLDTLSSCASRQLIEKGIRYGPEWKQRDKDEKRRVKEKVKKRILDNKCKKDEKEIQAKKRKLAAIDAITDVHLATTKEALDILFHGPKAAERLKDQIRFRALVKGESITLAGNKQVLYDKLLEHISSSDNFNVN